MADGKEEREERKKRLEQEKVTRPEDRSGYEQPYDWEPERQES